ELRDRAATDQDAKRRTDCTCRNIECGCTLAVDLDQNLRRVEGQRVLHYDKAAGLFCLALDLLGHLVDVRGFACRLDDHRDWQAATSTRQGWRREHQRLCAGKRTNATLNVGLDLLLRAIAISPVLECPDS